MTIPVASFLVPRSFQWRCRGSQTRTLFVRGTKSDTSDSASTESHNYHAQSKVQRIDDSLEELLLQALWQQIPFDCANQLVQSVIAGDDNKADTRLVPLPSALDTSATTTNSISNKYQKLFRRLLVDTSTSNNDHDKEQEEDDDTFHQPQSQSKPPPNSKSYRQSYRLDIAYYGPSFCGWQTQPPASPQNTHNFSNRTLLLLPSVQQTLEEWLQESGMFVPSKRAQKNFQKEKRDSIIRADLRAAGRTDAGVHAVGQVARFRTWVSTNNDNTTQEGDETNKDSDNETVNAQNIHDHINEHPMAGTDFRCVSVAPVSSQFHPTFGASCRAYLYVMDVPPIQELLQNSNTTGSMTDLVRDLQSLLQSLEGQDLEYVAVSYGKIKTQTTICHLFVARAFLAANIDNDEPQALCIQLVGNRFLRRMVRILVATAMREAIIMSELQQQQKNHDNDHQPQSLGSRRLLEILETTDRRQAARPAPSQGLIFAGALFDDA